MTFSFSIQNSYTTHPQTITTFKQKKTEAKRSTNSKQFGDFTSEHSGNQWLGN